VRVFAALLRRDLAQMFGGGRRGGALLPVLFFLAVAMLFPFAVGPNPELLARTGLAPFVDRPAGALSGGMKQKLALACALIHKPDVLMLDEPTTGVDPVSRREFWSLLNELHHDGLTILVSTPYMDEAGLCDRIGLMQQGKLLSTGTPKEIISSFQQPEYPRSLPRLAYLADLKY